MSQTSRVEELVSLWEQLLEDGQFVPPEELCSDCPELLDEVQSRIKQLEPRVQNETMAPETLQATFVTEEEEEFAESATVMEPENDDSEVGALVMQQHYRKLRFHARGGLGEIYCADDSQLKREVALKFIQAKHRKRKDCAEQFRLEAEVTARLDHPGVVPVYGFTRAQDGRLCYAMRFIQGESLDERVASLHAPSKKADGETVSIFDRTRNLELRNVLGEFVTVCQTIAYAHIRGILHRDIKPDNVMMGKYGETLVVDWGLAMPIVRDDSAKASGEATLMPTSGSGQGDSSRVGPVGTPAYMSPEQATGFDQLGPASDIFGLGAVLYKIVTGRAPYRGDSARETLSKARHVSYKPVREINPEVPAALESICHKAMEVVPENRYLTALDLASDVEHFLADEPVAAHKESALGRAMRWMRKNRGKTQSILTLVLLALVTLTVWTTAAVINEQNLVNQKIESLKGRFEFNEALILQSVDQLRGDINLLAKQGAVLNAAQEFDSLPSRPATTKSENAQALSRLFTEFLAQNPNYMQVRYLGKDGHEKVRVDRIAPIPRISAMISTADERSNEENEWKDYNFSWNDGPPEKQSTFKGNRSYFTETQEIGQAIAAGKTPDRLVYFSKININSESSGKQWNIPVIRACAPVLSEDKQWLGVVIINMHFHQIVESIKKSQVSNLSVYLADESGSFLFFPNNDDIAFSFERGLEFNMGSLFDELMDFSQSVEGVVEESDVEAHPALLITGPINKDSTTLWTEITGHLSGETLKTVQRNRRKSDITEYGKEQGRAAKDGGDARPMAIIRSSDSIDLYKIKEELDSDSGLGKGHTSSILPSTGLDRRHAIYCRKVFLEPELPASSKKERRFICVMLVLDY